MTGIVRDPLARPTPGALRAAISATPARLLVRVAHRDALEHFAFALGEGEHARVGCGTLGLRGDYDAIRRRRTQRLVAAARLLNRVATPPRALRVRDTAAGLLGRLA